MESAYVQTCFWVWDNLPTNCIISLCVCLLPFPFTFLKRFRRSEFAHCHLCFLSFLICWMFSPPFYLFNFQTSISKSNLLLWNLRLSCTTGNVTEEEHILYVVYLEHWVWHMHHFICSKCHTPHCNGSKWHQLYRICSKKLIFMDDGVWHVLGHGLSYDRFGLFDLCSSPYTEVSKIFKYWRYIFTGSSFSK